MTAITQTCSKCTKQFLVIDPEQQFLQEKGLPLPILCPVCRQERRTALRGERKLYRTKCQQCSKDIIVAYDPTKTESKILCREDYERYNTESDYIITDPLPGIETVVPAQTQQQNIQPTTVVSSTQPIQPVATLNNPQTPTQNDPNQPQNS